MVNQSPVPVIDAVVAVCRCACVTVRLLVQRRIRLRDGRLGEVVRFADGTSSRIYRETVLEGVTVKDPCALVVEFRLRGVKGRGHALFRWECSIRRCSSDSRVSSRSSGFPTMSTAITRGCTNGMVLPVPRRMRGRFGGYWRWLAFRDPFDTRSSRACVVISSSACQPRMLSPWPAGGGPRNLPDMAEPAEMHFGVAYIRDVGASRP